MMMHPLFLLACISLFAGCGAWERVPEPTPGAEKAFKSPDRTTRISPLSALEAFKSETKEINNYLLYDGDDIAIDVVGRPELSGVQRIGPDGRVTLPIAGSIYIRNLTREQAAAKIYQALSPFYLNVFTTVGIKSYNSNRIVVIGRVEHPGELTFNSPPTLLEILAQAGGMPLLRKEQVLTRCAVIRGDKILWIDVAQLLIVDTGLNVPLQRNDVVYIPDSNDTAVFVLGAVNHPGVLHLTPQMSFIDVLGQACGVTRDGNTHDIHLIRPCENVNMSIDLSDFLKPQAKLNVKINEGDIVYVPHHVVNKVGYILQQINPFSTIFTIKQVGAAP